MQAKVDEIARLTAQLEAVRQWQEQGSVNAGERSCMGGAPEGDGAPDGPESAVNGCKLHQNCTGACRA